MGSPFANEKEAESTIDSIRARRTAFLARFIVLREGKRTRAHRIIEAMSWANDTTAEQLADLFRAVFKENGDNMTPVERDVKRALQHAQRPLNHFIREYSMRATMNFIDALFDYERSNTLLFGDDEGDEQPKPGGWRMPRELLKERLRDSGEQVLRGA